MWSAFTPDGAMVETCLLLYNALFHVSGIQYMARWNYTESVFLNADPHPHLKQKIWEWKKHTWPANNTRWRVFKTNIINYNRVISIHSRIAQSQDYVEIICFFSLICPPPIEEPEIWVGEVAIRGAGWGWCTRGLMQVHCFPALSHALSAGWGYRVRGEWRVAAVKFG